MTDASESLSPEDLEEKKERTGSELEVGVVETTREADQQLEPKIYDGRRKKKSPYQQEFKWARQRESRQAARQAKQNSTGLKPPGPWAHLPPIYTRNMLSHRFSSNPRWFS